MIQQNKFLARLKLDCFIICLIRSKMKTLLFITVRITMAYAVHQFCVFPGLEPWNGWVGEKVKRLKGLRYVAISKWMRSEAGPKAIFLISSSSLSFAFIIPACSHLPFAVALCPFSIPSICACAQSASRQTAIDLFKN